MEGRITVCAVVVVAGVFSLAVAREIGVKSSETSSGRRTEYEPPAVVEVRGHVNPSASPPMADSNARWFYRITAGLPNDFSLVKAEYRRCRCAICAAHQRVYPRIALDRCIQCHVVDMTLDAPKIRCGIHHDSTLFCGPQPSDIPM